MSTTGFINNLPAELETNLRAMQLGPDDIINRPQLAALGGVAKSTLHYAMKYNRDLPWPQNLGNRTRHKFRAADAVAFLASYPLDTMKIEWNPTRKAYLEGRDPYNPFDNRRAQDFIRGEFDRKTAKAFRRSMLAFARQRTAKTQRVHVEELPFVPDIRRETDDAWRAVEHIGIAEASGNIAQLYF